MACGPKAPPAPAVPASASPVVEAPAVQAPGPAPVEPAPAAPPAEASPPRRSELVYLVMVDRFYNGDPSNDGAVDKGDPQAFHGGDLAGVARQLDYLDALGVTTVWLTPVFAMRTEKIDEWGAFHGYWVKDLGRVEPRFGDETQLYRLSRALHDRGMRLVLDMVWNHTDYEAPLLTEHPDWYHDTGDITDWDDPVDVVTGRVHGLPDLAQEEPAVSAYLRETSLRWIERGGADGFRVDAVRHMPLPFLADMNASLHAARPGLWTVGEDFNGDATALARTLDQGGFDAVFDFPLRYAMVDAFCRDAPMQRIASVLSADRLVGDPTRLVTFLDNHDTPRILTECSNEAWRVDTALTFLMNVRGTPSLTWGTELALSGGEEPANRADMPWGRVGDLFLDRREGIQRAAALRAETPAAWRGHTAVLRADADHLVVAQVLADSAVVLRTWRGAPTGAPGLPDWVAVAGVARGPGTRQSGGPRGSAEGVGLHLDVTRLDWGGEGPAPWAHLLGAAPAQTVKVAVTDAPPGELKLVGAPPELGGWDPTAAPALVRGEDGTATGEVALPAGVVAAFKVVALGADGAPTWEPRPDRYLLVPRGGDEAAVELGWGR